MLLPIEVQIVSTRSPELNMPIELWTYAVWNTSKDTIDCDCIAKRVAVTKADVVDVMKEVEQIDGFVGWVLPKNKSWRGVEQ